MEGKFRNLPAYKGIKTLIAVILTAVCALSGCETIQHLEKGELSHKQKMECNEYVDLLMVVVERPHRAAYYKNRVFTNNKPMRDRITAVRDFTDNPLTTDEMRAEFEQRMRAQCQ